MYQGLQVKYPLCFSDFNKNLNFLNIFFRKIVEYQISLKSVYWDRRSYMTKLMFAFRNFVNAPEG